MGSSDTLRVWYEETDVDRVLRHLGHNGGETNIECSRLASRRALAEITRLRKEVEELRDRADKIEAAALGEADPATAKINELDAEVKRLRSIIADLIHGARRSPIVISRKSDLEPIQTVVTKGQVLAAIKAISTKQVQP